MKHLMNAPRHRLLGAGVLAATLLAPWQSPMAATIAQRTAAVNAVIDNAAQCQGVDRFYWEIGNANGALASGREGLLAPTANTKMAVASAGKWLYGAYVVQANNGQLTQDDIWPLTMRGEYIHWDVCLWSWTVGKCFEHDDNDTVTPNPTHKFNYKGSQLQAHAVNEMGLGSYTRSQLAAEMQSYLGTNLDFTFNVSSPAAGMRTNAANYALFLRKLLGGSLIMGSHLSAHSTDAGPGNIQNGGASPPYDSLGEDWDYAPGHWIENDPNVGDGAFSSPGAFGFYPWIDASETYYGVLARHKLSADAFITSMQCGRTMRDAWLHPANYPAP